MAIQSQEFLSGKTSDTIKLITKGRRTKLPHVVEIRFTFRDGSFFVLAGERTSDWVRNALKEGKAKVRTHEFVFNVSARIATREEMAEAVEGFSSKYGSRIVREWYSNPAACISLTPQERPLRRGTVKGEGEATMTYDEWLSQSADYYRGIAGAFDSAAEEYDFTIGRNYINTWIRKRSIRELLRFAKPTDIALEVGCGTGAEAIEIAEYVAKIIATDVSDKMIEILSKKVQARGLTNRIIPLQVRAADISKAGDLTDGRKVDLAYSFNGALNCEPELEDFVRELSSIIVEGGYFVCSIRNSFCLSEALSHAVVLQFDKMTPRKNQPVMVSVGGMDIPAFYYQPATFADFFSTNFKLRKLIGLPTLLPPAYLSDYYVKFKNVASFLERLEGVLSDRFPFNRVGDQSLFVFQKL